MGGTVARGDMNPFHPVIHLPDGCEVYDFTQGYDPDRPRGAYGIGRYNEKRVGMYTTALFAGARDVHMGIDLAAPVGTPIHAFDDGEIHRFGVNPADGDYGCTVVTRHTLDGRPVYALHGHLSARSLEGKREGQRIARGEIIAWVGDRHENGNWNPHLHFQLSWEAPDTPDMPGAVSDADRAKSLEKYPDPRRVLGPIY